MIKKIKIKNIVDVILIPNRYEYNNIKDDLWWSEIELNSFHINYMTCLQVIKQMNNVNMNEAKKILDNQNFK